MVMDFMAEAARLAAEGVAAGEGGPFGAVIVKDGRVVGASCNRVLATNDPTAHAEIVAIRNACRKIGDFQLTGCRIFTSCEPCPMCLGAIYWARPEALFWAGARTDAAAAGFDDGMIYEELALPSDARRMKARVLLREEAQALFREWIELPDKILY